MSDMKEVAADNTRKQDSMRIIAWLLAFSVTLTAFSVWAGVRLNGPLSGYDFFPLLGLMAYGLMWTHYVVGALRRFMNVPRETLQNYFQITGWAVLVLIIAHPSLSTFLLWSDGFGLPPWSYLTVYPGVIERLALLAAVTALTAFLAFELNRWFRGRSWWRFIEYANVTAMFLIFFHALTLGGELSVDWFRVVWYIYGSSLLVSIIVTHVYKRKGRI